MNLNQGNPMRALIPLLFCATPLAAADWRPITTDLLKSEKFGFGGLCGVVVDHATGQVVIDMSDKGLYQSTDQGKSWKFFKAIKGRTEWPGCLMLDPVGPGKKM